MDKETLKRAQTLQREIEELEEWQTTGREAFREVNASISEEALNTKCYIMRVPVITCERTQERLLKFLQDIAEEKKEELREL